MFRNRFNKSAGLIRYIPEGPPSFKATLQSAWGCLLSRTAHNCYSFALDIPDHGRGSPGFLNLTENEKWNVQHAQGKEWLHQNLIEDELILTDIGDYDPHIDHVIAASFKEDDWHFYRLDDDGIWSHKFGQKAAEKIFVKHPAEHAQRIGFKMVGLYKVPLSGIEYRQNYYWDPDNIP